MDFFLMIFQILKTVSVFEYCAINVDAGVHCSAIDVMLGSTGVVLGEGWVQHFSLS